MIQCFIVANIWLCRSWFQSTVHHIALVSNNTTHQLLYYDDCPEKNNFDLKLKKTTKIKLQAPIHGMHDILCIMTVIEIIPDPCLYNPDI